MNEALSKIALSRKSGEEPIHHNGRVTGGKLLDFWRWSASDLVSNATRGIFAEYLVACALQLDLENEVRAEWDAFDLLSPSGTKIEVKSAAYLQSWQQLKLSPISFTIRPTQNLESGSNDLKRQGDVYVFCLLHHQDKATLDPLNVDQWCFYVVSTATLNKHFPTQQSVRLSVLLKKINSCVANFDEIGVCIKKMKL